MESLQLAQMLADISDLSAADQRAASAMVNANKTLPTNPQPQGQGGNLKPPTSAPGGSLSPSSAAANRFDKMGRKILTPPAMSRTNSSTGPASRQGSVPSTPRGELDEDVHQAGTLMSLYDIRARLKQQDSTGLKKAREQIDALIAKNKQQHGGQASQPEGPKQDRPRPISRTYTFPREPATGSNENK
ncbi:unnamed protein product [Discula destructiva]